jgi:hypothetical protein
MWIALEVAVCACLLATVGAAADKPAANSHRVEATEAKPLREAWPTETLSGKIMMVDAAKKLVIVTTPDGVPFDMQVTPRTHILLGGQKLTFENLNQDLQKRVSIHFVPERAGDIARSIQVTG